MTTYEDAMPSSYDTQPIGQPPEVLDRGYVTSMAGMLLAVEIALSLITFICASVFDPFVKDWGGGWVMFVSMTAFVLCIILYVFYAFMIVQRLPAHLPRPLAELIFYGVWTIFYFICGIVASVKGGEDASIGACAFFSFATMLAFGADAFFKFMSWRAGPPTATLTTGPPTTTTTATTTASAAGPVTPAEVVVEKQEY